jgi:hypothetical protein
VGAWLHIAHQGAGRTGGERMRAQRRLELASGLMGWPAGSDVLALIRALPAPERNHLRGLVDWVEDYERNSNG